MAIIENNSWFIGDTDPGEADQEGCNAFQGAYPTPQFRVIIPRDGVLQNYRENCLNNTLTQPMVRTVLVNGAATAMVITYGAGATGKKSYLSPPVSVSGGDEVSFRGQTTPTGVGNGCFGTGSVEFVPS